MNDNVKFHTKCSVSRTFWGCVNSHCDVREAVTTGRMISYCYDDYHGSVVECEDVQSDTLVLKCSSNLLPPCFLLDLCEILISTNG